MKKNLQEILGLTPNESKVYSALIGGVEPDPATLVTETGLPRTRIYEVLASLSAKNLVEKRTGGGYRLIPPKQSIPVILEQIDREYSHRKGSIKEFGDYLHRVWNDTIQSDLSPGVEVYNIEDCEQLFLSDIQSIKQRLWIAAADTNTSIDMRKSGSALASAYREGMQIRYLAANKSISSKIGSRITKFGPFQHMNVSFRTHTDLYSSFVLIDSLLYLFFFGAEEALQATTLRTSSKQLVSTFEWMFSQLWSNGHGEVFD